MTKTKKELFERFDKELMIGKDLQFNISRYGKEIVKEFLLQELENERRRVIDEVISTLPETKGYDDYEWGSVAEGWNMCLEEVKAKLK